MKLTTTSLLLTILTISTPSASQWITEGSPCSPAAKVAYSYFNAPQSQIYVCAGSPTVWQFQADCPGGKECYLDESKNWAWCA